MMRNSNLWIVLVALAMFISNVQVNFAAEEPKADNVVDVVAAPAVAAGAEDAKHLFDRELSITAAETRKWLCQNLSQDAWTMGEVMSIPSVDLNALSPLELDWLLDYYKKTRKDAFIALCNNQDPLIVQAIKREKEEDMEKKGLSKVGPVLGQKKNEARLKELRRKIDSTVPGWCWRNEKAKPLCEVMMAQAIADQKQAANEKLAMGNNGAQAPIVPVVRNVMVVNNNPAPVFVDLVVARAQARAQQVKMQARLNQAAVAENQARSQAQMFSHAAQSQSQARSQASRAQASATSVQSRPTATTCPQSQAQAQAKIAQGNAKVREAAIPGHQAQAKAQASSHAMQAQAQGQSRAYQQSLERMPIPGKK
jgi:hypothetical protein